MNRLCCSLPLLAALSCCRDTTRRLAVAWLLASACLLHHATHWLGPAAPHWLHVLASTPVHAAMSALALLGGWQSRSPTCDLHAWRMIWLLLLLLLLL